MIVHRIKARIAREKAAPFLLGEGKGRGGLAQQVHTPHRHIPGSFLLPGTRPSLDQAFLSHFHNFLLFLPSPLPAATKNPEMSEPLPNQKGT